MKLLLAILLAVSSVASVTPSEDFLLRKAAVDFHKTLPSEIVRVRHVRFGQVLSPENEKQDVLCGEFMPAGKTGNQWISFATIKSRYQGSEGGKYEQWIGGQAEVVCKVGNVTTSDDKDLSSTLQQRLDHFSKSK